MTSNKNPGLKRKSEPNQVLSWASDVDDATLEQATRIAQLPFIPGPLALMPDAHLGMGATIGSVIPTKGAIIPSAVGVDIGCGMVATKTSLDAVDLPDDLSSLHSRISAAVPAGVGQGNSTIDLNPLLYDGYTRLSPKLQDKSRKQMGSLGSGNHFVEICLDESEAVWIVLHSGSRGVGNELAKHHIEGAKHLMKRYFIDLPDPDMAYLVENTHEFDAYIQDMMWAQAYAFSNRQVMMAAVIEQFEQELGCSLGVWKEINCHHNFTQLENHYGQNVWLTRKGAVRARLGEWGVIPGSMGTSTYIVTGLGSRDSYHSCSHGAGRKMSRNQARKTLDEAGLVAAMEGKAWNGNAKALLDEDPRSYKDVHQVMRDQQDLVKVEHILTQILNYKGT